MAFTREQVEEIIAALRNDAALRELVRGSILSDDFQSLPRAMERLTERLETLVAATDMRFERVENRLDAVGQRLAQIDERLARIEKQVNDSAGKPGNLEGDVFEGRFIRNVRSHIGPRFRRPRPLDLYSDEAVEKALALHPLSDRDLRDIATADLIVWSFDTEVGEERALVIEISRTVDVGDVERARRRAQLLAQAGVNAVAVVAGMALDDRAAARAGELSVVTLVQQAEPAA